MKMRLEVRKGSAVRIKAEGMEVPWVYYSDDGEYEIEIDVESTLEAARLDIFYDGYAQGYEAGRDD
jgi:hypothetical protein